MKINLLGLRITITRKDVKPIEQAAAGAVAISLLKELNAASDRVEAAKVPDVAKIIAQQALNDAQRKIISEFNKIAGNH